MNFLDIASFSIAVPAVVGMIRFKKIDSSYSPFVYLIWIGLINELLSSYVIHRGHSNALNGNIYLLLEGVLIVYQFSRWRLFLKSRMLSYVTVCGLMLFWITEALIIRDIQLEFVSYYLIFHSFTIVLFSISKLNLLIANEAKDLWKHPAFIISVCYVIFFSYAIFVELIVLLGLNLSNSFQANVESILSFINLFVNLLYALAVLWIPKRYGFSL